MSKHKINRMVMIMVLTLGMVWGSCGRDRNVLVDDERSQREDRSPESALFAGRIATTQGDEVSWTVSLKTRDDSEGAAACVLFTAELPSKYALDKDETRNTGCVTLDGSDDLQIAGYGQMSMAAIAYVFGRSGSKVERVALHFGSRGAMEVATKRGTFAFVFRVGDDPLRVVAYAGRREIGACDLESLGQQAGC